MFSWFKNLFSAPSQSQSAKAADNDGPAIAIPLLKGASFPFETIAGPLAKLRPAGKKVTDIDIKDLMLMCTVDGVIVALALMPAPVPGADLQGPCATSIMWPKGTSADTVKAHKSHIIATAIGGKATPLQRRLILSQIIALLASHPDLLGIYWPESSTVHHPTVFADFAQNPQAADLLPLFVWIDFRTGKNPDGTSICFTQGLNALGLMEIEYPKSSMAPADLREWMQNIAKYLLDNGPVLLHGQTIGGSAEEKIKITHVPSQFGSPSKVIHLQE